MITVYYDGLCHLCSREIDHYRKRKGAGSIRFVDIFGSEFDAKAEGLDPMEIHRTMHVRRADGTIATGVEAFVTIWQALPGYRPLARIAKFPIVRPLLNAGYVAFARVRPYLPRRRADACASSPLCDLKEPS